MSEQVEPFGVEWVRYSPGGVTDPSHEYFETRQEAEAELERKRDDGYTAYLIYLDESGNWEIDESC